MFNSVIDHSKAILYVPLAMDNDRNPYSGCYEWIKGELSTIDVPGIDMVLSFEELASVDYDNYSAVFIGGGNTFKLLKGLKESDSFKKIKKFINKDGVVFAGSADAVVFGYDITCCV